MTLRERLVSLLRRGRWCEGLLSSRGSKKLDEHLINRRSSPCPAVRVSFPSPLLSRHHPRRSNLVQSCARLLLLPPPLQFLPSLSSRWSGSSLVVEEEDKKKGVLYSSVLFRRFSRTWVVFDISSTASPYFSRGPFSNSFFLSTRHRLEGAPRHRSHLSRSFS